MVRFRYKRPAKPGRDMQSEAYFPFYKEAWTAYNPDDTSICVDTLWETLWEKDPERDELHRKNSYYYRIDYGDKDDDEQLQEPSTLAILLFGSVIFCLFTPQILDLLMTAFCPGTPRPPSPPSPPPGPKSRKKLKMYHYAQPEPMTDAKNSQHTSRNSKNTVRYYYDPDNILNYVSATRIRALEAFNGNEADGENEHPE